MNRIIIILAFLSFSLTASSQKRLFKKALDNGPRRSGYYYLLQNKGNKYITLDDVKRYAAENDYLLGNVTYKEILRFREMVRGIASVEFMPKDSYTAYIYSNINASINLPNPPVNCSAYVYSISSTSLKHTGNLNWSGNIVDGKAEGDGVMAANFGQYFLFIRGQFNKGYPVGQLKIYKYTTNGTYDKYNQQNLSKEFYVTVGEFHDGRAFLHANGKYGYVDVGGNLVIKNEYDDIVADFYNGRATVVKDKEEQIIDRNGTFLDYTNKQKNIFASESYLNQMTGMIYNDVEKALYMLEKANQYNNPKAPFWLGMLYSNTNNGKLNYDEAVKWFKVAVEKGDMEALYELGNIYSNSQWRGCNETTAFKYYMRGAVYGNYNCNAKVGLYYEKNHIYSFNMYDVDYRTKYSVRVNTSTKTLQAETDGRIIFSYSYYDFKQDDNRGRIGFSMNRNMSVDMNALASQYFIMSIDGILVARFNEEEEYPMMATNKAEFLITYHHMTNALNGRSVEPPKPIAPPPTPSEYNHVYEVAEVMPEFPGGIDALMKYLTTHIKYPSRAQENNIQGTVVVKFVVGKDGEISSVKIAKALDPDCDKEAVRVIKSMPRWKPARQNGKPVNCQFSVPIRFKLN